MFSSSDAESQHLRYECYCWRSGLTASLRSSPSCLSSNSLPKSLVWSCVTQRQSVARQLPCSLHCHHKGSSAALTTQNVSLTYLQISADAFLSSSWSIAQLQCLRPYFDSMIRLLPSLRACMPGQAWLYDGGHWQSFCLNCQNLRFYCGTHSLTFQDCSFSLQLFFSI